MFLIKSASSNCIKDLVNLHQQAFKSLFSEKLGNRYLQFFYKSIINSKFSKCFICQENGKVLGFICGTCDRNRFYSLKSKIYIAYFIVKKFLFLKISTREINNFINYSFLIRKINIKAELLSLVVDKDKQQQSIGSKLLERLIEYFNEKKVDRFIVFSNDKIKQGLDFYKKRNFTVINKIKQGSYTMFCFLYEFR